MRDGVSASRVAVHPGPWVTVAQFLQARMPTVADWHQRLLRGEVLDATGRAVHERAPAEAGAVLWYWRQPPPEPRLPFEVEVLFQDEHLVIVDKPHFMSVTPGGQHLHETVLVRLKKQLQIGTLVPMHRLDRETAGVMAFIVRPDDRNAYQGLPREQRVHKVYEAVAPWRADLLLPQVYSSRLASQDGDGFMQMLTLPGEPNAHTRIELIQRWDAPAGADPDASASASASAGAVADADADADAGDDAAQPRAPLATPTAATPSTTLAHYRLTPLTGRKHQLRVQLCALGLPIVGDRIYPRLWPQPAPGTTPDYSQPLQLLARELTFTDPCNGQPRHFVSRRRLLCVPQMSEANAQASRATRG